MRASGFVRIFAVGILAAGLWACSEDPGPDDDEGARGGGPELTAEQKLSAMRAYLPWTDMMTVLDYAARVRIPAGDIDLDWEQGRLLIHELREQCQATQTEVSNLLAGLEMDESLALESETGKDCPIVFKQNIVARTHSGPGEKLSNTELVYSYHARTERGRALSDVQSLKLTGKGYKHVRAGAEGLTTAEYRESYAGQLRSAKHGEFNVQFEVEKKASWQGTQSRVVSTRTRTLKGAQLTAQWKVVRTYVNRKQISVSYSLNGQPIPESEYLDLVGKVTATP